MSCTHIDKHTYYCTHCSARFCDACSQKDHFGISCNPPSDAQITRFVSNNQPEIPECGGG